MEINDCEKMYYRVEQNAMKRFFQTKDLKNSVAHALFDSYKSLKAKDILDFVDYLEFTHGNSIKVAYNQGLGNIAKIDYEILSQCKGIEKELKNATHSEITKTEARYSQKVDTAKKHAEELLDELSK